MDGWDFISALESSDRWRDMPVFVFSATVMRDALLDAGAYWPKPLVDEMFGGIHNTARTTETRAAETKMRVCLISLKFHALQRRGKAGGRESGASSSCRRVARR